MWSPVVVKAGSWDPSLHPREEGGRFGEGGGSGAATGLLDRPPSNLGTGGREKALTSGKVSSRQLKALQKQAAEKIRNAPKPTKADIARNRELLQHSKRAGGELRGNSTDRARRTQSLLNEFGDGHKCGCVHCGAVLDKESLTQDKIYTVEQGGRYRLENLLPACYSCNNERGSSSATSYYHKVFL